MTPELIRQLLNTAQALFPERGQLRRALLGDSTSWSTDTCPATELQLLKPDQGLKAAQTLAQLLIPALPKRLPAWARLRPTLKPAARLVLRPSRVYRYVPARRQPDPTPDQAWFFVNGLATDRNVLMLNAAYLSELFGRPLTLIHNASCGLLPDVAECALGKGWSGVSEAARVAFAPIYVALKQPQCRRVVLLAHSQGTVITAVLLWLLRGLYPPTSEELLEGEHRCPEQRIARELADKWGFPRAEDAGRKAARGKQIKPPLSFEELAKLEIYAFANCASLMGPIDRKHGLPYLESYGNQHDVIARLGVLSRAPGPQSQRIRGERFIRRDAGGHLLNAHYLHPMECEWRAAREQGQLQTQLKPMPGTRRSQPRLFEYFGGATPSAMLEPDSLPSQEPAPSLIEVSRAAA